MVSMLRLGLGLHDRPFHVRKAGNFKINLIKVNSAQNNDILNANKNIRVDLRQKAQKSAENIRKMYLDGAFQPKL